MTHNKTRRLNPGDSELWISAVRSLVDPGDRDNELIAISECEAALRNRSCYMLVTTTETEIVGLLAAYQVPDLEAGGILVYLYDIEVHNSYRRQGVGTQLIKALQEHCDRDDVDYVWAGTATDNRAAQALFNKTGATHGHAQFIEYEWVN